ncbi:MAG: NTP transferase domain-containing protein [Spirochaetaceae bacterium]|nr:NTP transferase domain-containing protein [Spirochaetaceae bacterium]
MELKYIIVQAGGRGSRMESLTRNKPKALVPVDNLPMIFHLFRKFQNKKFIIIGDYKYDVLEKYLKEFANVDYKMVRGTGHQGTCAGMANALEKVPEGESFLLIWCDLVLPSDYTLPASDNNIIGISKDFSCRWSYKDNKFIEERSSEYGVAGYFIFKEKSYISDVPTDGEFVRWLQSKGMTFEEEPLYKTHEYGLYSVWDELPKLKTRPFNRIEKKDGKLYKIPVDKQGNDLAVREQAWYKKLKGKHFNNLPEIYGYDPLCMEEIKGKNIYEYSNIPFDKKQHILKQIVECLESVHIIGSITADKDSYKIAYLDKTYDRLKKVRFLVPFANDEYVTVNGRRCRNIFYHIDEVNKLVMKYLPSNFKLIHGDCTFSNMMLKNDEIPVLIDPRGYFGNTELYGDEAYDWVKLYYSIYSNYDQFNLKRFNLYINEKDEYAVYDDRGNEVSVAPKSVKLEIDSNGWEDLEDYFFELLDGKVTRRQMKLFLAITWLSLTTYAWDDYDSICGAFYKGLLYLEDALQMKEENEKIELYRPFESAYKKYFADNCNILVNALKSIRLEQFEGLICDCEETLRAGHKIITSGLGKNVPICDKFTGTMLSLGFEAAFMHTNTAVHGDMGMVHPGDLVIILTKSGSTAESVYLEKLLEKREGVKLWLLSFNEHSDLADSMTKKLIISLEHEGDLWDVVPNNSTTLNLIVLQEVAIELSRRFGLELVKDYKPNHPGGAIGEKLRQIKDEK